jgi:acyl-CoA synthetase (AMP-forming)/AMP-acid ligase II
LALIYGDDKITYAEMMRRIETMAGWPAAQAIGPGHVGALLMQNNPAFLELTFALSHLGAVSLPINYRLATEEVGYILDNADARLLLCDQELAATADGWPHLHLVDAAAQSNSTRLVFVKAGQALPLEALQTHCRRKLAGFKVPKQLIVRTDLPLKPSGKVLKRVLREEISRDLQAPES